MEEEFKLASADPGVVRELMEKLTEAFEQFASSRADATPDGLTYADALMGCHNFYKRIILDLESRGVPGGVLRRAAVHTLRQSLKV